MSTITSTPPIDITTIIDGNWQLSIAEFGQIVTGADDILLCIHNILFTRKGEMPLDMQQGSNIWKYVDKPLSVAVPGVISECLDAIGSQEPRVKIGKIVPVYDTETGGVTFKMYMTVIEVNTSLGYTLNLSALINGSRSFSDGYTVDFG